MRNFFENLKTLIIELIGLIGGFIWANQTNWDYEPVILLAVSLVGILMFIILRLLPSRDDRPIIDLEFVDNGSSRSAPQMIANMSPKDAQGYFLMQHGGTYLFRVKRAYQLILRNNSENVAYNLELYKVNLNHPIVFESRYNPLEPLKIDSPKSIDVIYEVNKPMTHDEADTLVNSQIPNELNNFFIIAKYQSGRRRTYYTKFMPPNNNQHLTRFPGLKNLRKI